MKTALKRIGYTASAIVGVLLLFIVISFVNHLIQLKKESALLATPGVLVNVHNHKMHVYTEGSGPQTLVFLSGGGTSAPVLDFKALYSKLAIQHRIAVVEKAGYGFSETADIPRDIDTILEETRSALTKAGQNPPYILFPHSMSGIEALYWAQKYPDEVKAIIGLDSTVPEVYEKYPLPSKLMMNVTTLAARAGVTRFFPGIAESSAAIQEKRLSTHDVKLYRALFYKNTQTVNMNEEMKMIKANAEKVDKQGIPDVPMYFFISSGDELPVDHWQADLIKYSEKLHNGRYLIIDGGHYLHNTNTEQIAEESAEYIAEL
jgi:pimeloyl-ACP methyl ester carboxylesterase